MTKLLTVFLMSASVWAADKVTGQDYRGWTEPLRRMYVGAYLDGYVHARDFAGKEVPRLIFDNLRQTTRQMVITELKAAKERGVEENWGALCLPRKLAQDTDKINIVQMLAILDRYVADHPERWDKEVGDLAEEAFIEACEKRAKNP
jgi:hypothetical protein